MILNSAYEFLAMGGGGSQPGQPPSFWMMIPMILVFVVMWVMMTSSQRKRDKKHRAMMDTLKSGDRVATSSGIVGIVVSVQDKNITIRSADSKLEILKSAIADIIERKGEAGQTAS